VIDKVSLFFSKCSQSTRRPPSRIPPIRHNLGPAKAGHLFRLAAYGVLEQRAYYRVPPVVTEISVEQAQRFKGVFPPNEINK
jgi:hypothetical protein